MRITALLLFLTLFFNPLYLSAAQKRPSITMNFPEAVIADTMKRLVPLKFDGISKRMEGTITLVSVSKLQFLDHKLLCHLDLAGSNLNLITTVANQDIRLKLGSARVDFDCEAQIRYDAAQRKLYIRPVARGINGAEALQSGDIGKALLLFLNGQEFGIDIQELEPIIAEVSNKTVTIQTRITDFRIIKGALQLSLYPAVAATPR